MRQHPRLVTLALSILALAGRTTLAQTAAPRPMADSGHMMHHHGDATHGDSAYAALQQRGKVAMGVDQYASVHRFDALPDGGRIELQRPEGDSADVRTIRAHLREIAQKFAAGDFSTPAFVHMRDVPGTDVMAARRNRIRYEYSPLPAGGQVRIYTTDPEAVKAVHAFMAFQRMDHRAKGKR